MARKILLRYDFIPALWKCPVSLIVTHITHLASKYVNVARWCSTRTWWCFTSKIVSCFSSTELSCIERVDLHLSWNIIFLNFDFHITSITTGAFAKRTKYIIEVWIDSSLHKMAWQKQKAPRFSSSTRPRWIKRIEFCCELHPITKSLFALYSLNLFR